MKTQPFTLRTRSLVAGLLVLTVAQAALAQAPAGGRGAAAANFPRIDTLAPIPAALSSLLTIGQQNAIDAVNAAVADLNTAATNARTALTAASLASPDNPADLTAKAAALATAEQALAVEIGRAHV